MAQNEASKKISKKSKAVKLVFFVVLIFIISGISSVISDRYIFPWVASLDGFKNRTFFKQAMENVTVINKTEQVTVSENRDISSYTQKSASSVVEIISYTKGDKNPTPIVSQSVSGVIVASDGLVASFEDSFFVNKDAEYKVFSQDGKSFEAKIAATDPFSNIILLKLNNAENLPVAELIASEDIKTGMKTAVVGRSGFNSETSLRLGIISEIAKSYSLSGPLASSEKLQGVLFADLSDMGSVGGDTIVGGATVDQNGNLVGILGKRKEDTGGRIFIVPVNILKNVIDQYLGKGRIERATLGIYYVALAKESAIFFQGDIDHGALVYSSSGQQGLAVISGSPADQAGIKVGDIILNVDGEEVTPDQNLANLISQYKPGDIVELKINRSGKEMVVQVTLS